MARFIVFEGGEASGKSTQSSRLARRLGAVHTREPGGTRIGAALRELLLDARTTGLDDRAEALLMAADRAQHVAEVVRPALAAGRHVVSDRYIGSTLAYQGYGRGLAVVGLRRISAWAADDLWPDLIVLLDVPPEVATRRATEAPDRLEAAGQQFHDRVARGYRALANADSTHWVTIDGSGSPDEVEAAVWAAIAARLPDLADLPSAADPSAADPSAAGPSASDLPSAVDPSAADPSTAGPSTAGASIQDLSPGTGAGPGAGPSDGSARAAGTRD